MTKVIFLFISIILTTALAHADTFVIDSRELALANPSGNAVMISSIDSYTGHVGKTVKVDGVRPNSSQFTQLQDDLAFLWYASDKLGTSITVKGYDLSSISKAVADTEQKYSKSKAFDGYVSSLRREVRELLSRDCTTQTKATGKAPARSAQ